VQFRARKALADAIVVGLACLAASCGPPSSEKAQHLIGKTEAEVLSELGEPLLRGHTSLPPVRKGASQEEMRREMAKAESIKFLYNEDLVVAFNYKGYVISVRPAWPGERWTIRHARGGQ